MYQNKVKADMSQLTSKLLIIPMVVILSIGSCKNDMSERWNLPQQVEKDICIQTTPQECALLKKVMFSGKISEKGSFEWLKGEFAKKFGVSEYRITSVEFFVLFGYPLGELPSGRKEGLIGGQVQYGQMLGAKLSEYVSRVITARLSNEANKRIFTKIEFTVWLSESTKPSKNYLYQVTEEFTLTNEDWHLTNFNETIFQK